MEAQLRPWDVRGRIRFKRQKKSRNWDSPGSFVVKTQLSKAEGAGLNSGQEVKISHALWPKDQNHKTGVIL